MKSANQISSHKEEPHNRLFLLNLQKLVKSKAFLLLVFLFPSLLFAQIASVDLQKLHLVNPASYATQLQQKHPVALKAIREGVKPGTFKNVSVVYQNKVVFLNPASKKSLIKSSSKTPILKPLQLQQLQLRSDKIYVDKHSDLVFKPKFLNKDTLVLIQPKIDQVFKKINIPLQKVPITRANTDYALKNTQVVDQESDGDYTMKLVFNDTLYHFEKEIKKGKLKTKINFDVNLDGFIGFTNPTIEAKYSKNNGYKLVFHAKEKAQLKVVSDLKLEAEYSFPIWGYDIPIENFGSCKIGIFIVFEANGEVHLEASVKQGLQVDSGIQGKTFYFIPRSIKPIVGFQKNFEVDYEVKGKIKAFAGIDVEASIKFKSYALLKIRTRAGAEVKAEMQKGDASKLEAEIGARFLIDGKLSIKSYDKKFEIYNKYFLIWKKQTKNYNNYTLTINDADAYYDRIWGRVLKNSKAYNGRLTIKVTHANGKANSYQTHTDDTGLFAKREIPLVKGDQVFIKVPGSNAWSDPFSAQIPFSEVVITYADYYTNTVEGSVAGQIDYFPEIKKNHKKKKWYEVFNPRNSKRYIKSKTKNQDFDKAVSYKGNVDIISISNRKMYNKKIPTFNTSKKKPRTKRKSRTHKKKSRKPVLIKQKKVENLPLGMFRVSHVDIQPNKEVKARINIDGFVLESDYINTDGLIFTASVDEEKQGGIKHQTIQATDSYVIVNAFRSTRSPVGKIQLIKGIDMKHTPIHKNLPTQQITIPKIQEFKQAEHPLVYYNTTTDLKPIPKKLGFSIARTGAWKINNIYYDFRAITSATPIDGHRFEAINYTFEDSRLGLFYYQEKCKIDASALYKIQNNKPLMNNQIQTDVLKQFH